LFKSVLRYRTQQQKLVDSRVKLLSEIINNIRAVKLNAYERHFAKRVSDIRQEELVQVRRYGLLRSAIQATFSFTPILASVRKSRICDCRLYTYARIRKVTFITYSLSGHTLDPAIVFSSLQFFAVLRNPIGQLPTQISTFIDAMSAIRRSIHCFVWPSN
jgi:ATP-binding cassette subfamily C (CFTR/MRP) protein 1